MISAFITAVGQWITGVVGFVVSAFSGIVDVFWVSPDGVAPEEFTIYGLLMLFGLAVGFVGLAIGFIYRLLQK